MYPTKNRHEWKLAAAGIGAAAGLAMLGVGLAGGGGMASAEDPTEPAPVTTGETVTETTPPTSPETSVATPSVSVTTPSGFATPH
ncbi:hypothetical protein ACWDTP_14765 [Mycobacterium sp. NPDC003449]